MPRFDPAMPLVHPLPDPERVEVRRGLGYASFGGRELAMDLYLPAGRPPEARLPAVLLVHGEAPPELLRGVLGWGQYQGWGRLLAGEGLAGVAFEHSAVAAAVLAGPAAGVRCAALCYGPPGDLEPRPELPPLLVVRAGRDDPELNGDIDRFAAAAADRGLPVELVEVPDGHHAFDVLDDTDASRAAIRRVLGFLGERLAA